MLSPRDKKDRLTGMTSPAQVAAAIRSGKLIAVSAATHALLLKIAGRVAFGQTTPLSFPFRLPGPLPAGWRLTQATFTLSGGRLAGDGVEAGPAADPTALTVGASAGTGPAACNFVYGQSSYLTRVAVQWVYRVISEPDKHVQSLCARAVVDGLSQVLIALDMNTPGSNAALPGSAELGGALGVLARLRFLGPAPSAWTTTPLG